MENETSAEMKFEGIAPNVANRAGAIGAHFRPMRCYRSRLDPTGVSSGGVSEMKPACGGNVAPDPCKSGEDLEPPVLNGELTTERAHLNEIFSRVLEAVVLVDANGEIQRINPAFTEIFGYSEEEALGQSLDALIALAEPLEEIETHTGLAIAKRDVVSLERVRRRKDGIGIAVSFVKVPVPSPGTASSWYAVYRELKERKRLEDELRREQDRLRLLLEITNSLASRLDLRQLVEALSMDLLSVMQCDFCALVMGRGFCPPTPK